MNRPLNSENKLAAASHANTKHNKKYDKQFRTAMLTLSIETTHDLSNEQKTVDQKMHFLLMLTAGNRNANINHNSV